MAITYAEAEARLTEWTSSPALLYHARAVEAVMRSAADRYGAGEGDPTAWAITGLLHDADYDRWPDEHPGRIVAWLRERDEPVIAHAISAHHTRWGVPYETQLDRSLLACDELTGFVGACCFVRPDGIHSLTAASVRKKLKDKGFAAKVDRDEIRAGVELLGVDLDAHIRFVIDALHPHAERLGLSGSQPRPSST